MKISFMAVFSLPLHSGVVCCSVFCRMTVYMIVAVIWFALELPIHAGCREQEG